jgi:hypothetical protein
MTTTYVLPEKWEWKSYFGITQEFKDLEYQHLNNIVWFNEVFHGWNRYNSPVQAELCLELARRRGDNLREEWKPLPIPTEMETLVRMQLVKENGDIIGNWHCTIYEGKKIGTITHIENWQSFLL